MPQREPDAMYREKFILEEGITYLNCASMSPLLKQVKQAGVQALETRAHPWKIKSQDWFTNTETLRQLAAKIFATQTSNIALIPSASYGLAQAAKNIKLQAGKEIIVLEKQFPSNYYVWVKLAEQYHATLITVEKKPHMPLTESILEKINKNTGLIAIPNCHWIDGSWIDLEKISAAAKGIGAYLVLDLSQSLGVLPIDIEKIQPDFAVSVGYKWMLGPYGLSYMYISPAWQDQGEPLEYPWITKKGSENFSALTQYQHQYRDGARKYDMGAFPQFHLVPMAIAALTQILEWKIDYIQNKLLALTRDMAGLINRMGKAQESVPGVGHILSIPVLEQNRQILSQQLSDRNIIISFRDTTIRVSPHLYNTKADIEKLIECIGESNKRRNG